MAILPRKVGSVTLMRALGSDGATETYTGILDQPAGTQVIVRKVLPALARDPARLTSLRSRVGDLKPVRHPSLLGVLDAFEEDGELFIVSDWKDAVSLAEIVQWCADNDSAMPHNVFLDLAVQICNGLEALHSQPGVASGARNVLHLCLRPDSVRMTRDGEVLLGDFGLVRSPTLAPHSGGIRLKTAYLSPEQTHQDQKLTPASDLFSLGAVLYEVLTHRAMFRDSTPLKTIARVRRAEVTTQLLEVKEILPGLDRVLYRALSLNQRHRYQRAFVLREDLRGLMAGFSFSNIRGEARAFLEPLFQGRTRAIDEVLPPLPPAPTQETTNALLDDSVDFEDLSITGTRLTPLHGEGTGEDDDDVDTGTIDSLNVKLHDALDGHRNDTDDTTGPFFANERLPDGWRGDSVDPNVTQPFVPGVPSNRSPASNVSLGPSDLSELGFGALGDNDSEELDLLRAQTTGGLTSELQTAEPADDIAEDTAAAINRARQDIGSGAPLPGQGDQPFPTPSQLPHKAVNPPVDTGWMDDGFETKPSRSFPPPPPPNTPDEPAAPPRPVRKVQSAEAPQTFDSLPDPAPLSDPDAGSGLPAADPISRAERSDADVEPPSDPADDDRISLPLVIGAGVAGFVVVLGLFTCAGGSLLGIVGTQMQTTAVERPVQGSTEGSEIAPVADAGRIGSGSPAPVAAPPTPDPASAPVPATAPATAPFASPGPRPAPTQPRPVAAPDPAPSTASTRVAATAPSPRPMLPAIQPDPEPVVRPAAPAPSTARTFVPEPAQPSEPAESLAGGDATAAVDPTLRDADWDVDLMVAEEVDPLGMTDAPESPPAEPPEDLGVFATAAYAGQLDAAQQAALATVPESDDRFTRSRVLLYQNSKARGDREGRREWMRALMSVDANTYRPELLVEHAALAMADHDYATALDRANRAERYWARLPRDLVFTRKAMIHEIQAKASYAMYTRSDPPAEALLDGSIDAWTRYRTHVGGRSELESRADARIAYLEDVRERMHY